jgi:hypothetical protein
MEKSFLKFAQGLQFAIELDHTQNFYERLERFARDKRSSLFLFFASDDEKRFKTLTFRCFILFSEGLDFETKIFWHLKKTYSFTLAKITALSLVNLPATFSRSFTCLGS